MLAFWLTALTPIAAMERQTLRQTYSAIMMTNEAGVRDRLEETRGF